MSNNFKKKYNYFKRNDLKNEMSMIKSHLIYHKIIIVLENDVDKTDVEFIKNIKLTRKSKHYKKMTTQKKTKI